MSLKALSRAALLLVGAVIACPALASGQPVASATATATKPHRDPNLVIPDPHVRRGVLPNGLRYAIMSNASPKGVVSVRLGIGVGSFEEHDDERGVAHFVEHMAFNGSRHFADGHIDKIFAAKGVGFGRDQNAFTTLTSTSFHLDLPDADAQSLDLAFRWIRDVADGIDLTDDGVQREKGIVLAEKEARSNPFEQSQQEVIQFQTNNLRSAMRLPIGTSDSIKSMSPARLRAFYDRWYRPDNAVLVVVGDVPLDGMEQRIRAGFEDWKARGPAPTRAAVAAIDVRRGPDALMLADPHFTTVTSACRLRAPGPHRPEDVSRIRREALTQLWLAILGNRLGRRVNTATPPYLNAAMLRPNDGRDFAITCLLVTAIKDSWQGGLQAAEAEIRRFAADGPTDAEFETAVEQVRSQFRGQASAAATRQSSALATQLLTDLLEGDVTPDPHEAFRAFDVAVEGLHPDDVKAAFARDWAGSGPLLVLLSPEPQDKADLLNAWNRGEAATPLAKYVDEQAVKWKYASTGRPGRVVKRQRMPEGDFVRINYADGVVLNFKHTEARKNDVEIRVNFGSGRREIPNAQYITAELGADLFEAGGVGQNTYSEIDGLFSNGTWHARLAILDDTFVLTGATTRGSLKNELQIVAAYLTDPGFDPRLDAVLPTTLNAFFRLRRTLPTYVLSEAINRAIDPANIAILPPQETMARIRSSDFEALLKPAVTQSPLEVTIVGDVDEETATSLVAATLGALPARKARATARPDTWFLRFPDHPMPPIRVTHEGHADKALVGVFWPLYVATPERRREEMAILLMSHVMSDELRRRVRQELGKSYAPDTSTTMPDHANQGYLAASVEAYPADIDQITAEIRQVGDHMARGGIDAEALEQARRPLLSLLEEQRSNPSWWAGVLAGSARDPLRVKDSLAISSLLAGVTLDEVRKAAADWLSKTPIVVIATPVQKTPSAAATPGKTTR
jgi:zinc protease